MKDIPAFTTENGIASLVLRDIPFSKRAYVTVVSSENVEALAKEMIHFCKALGAQEVFGYGDAFAQLYPLTETILLMEGPKAISDSTRLQLVLDENAEEFCELYNKKMEHLKTACRMTPKEMARLIREEQVYFIFENGRMIGFGIVAGEKIRALASMEPGAGDKIVYALGEKISGDLIRLEVALSNTKALQLYERMGFRRVDVLDRWYKIF